MEGRSPWAQHRIPCRGDTPRALPALPVLSPARWRGSQHCTPPPNRTAAATRRAGLCPAGPRNRAPGHGTALSAPSPRRIRAGTSRCEPGTRGPCRLRAPRPRAISSCHPKPALPALSPARTGSARTGAGPAPRTQRSPVPGTGPAVPLPLRPGCSPHPRSFAGRCWMRCLLFHRSLLRDNPIYLHHLCLRKSLC